MSRLAPEMWGSTVVVRSRTTCTGCCFPTFTALRVCLSVPPVSRRCLPGFLKKKSLPVETPLNLPDFKPWFNSFSFLNQHIPNLGKAHINSLTPSLAVSTNHVSIWAPEKAMLVSWIQLGQKKTGKCHLLFQKYIYNVLFWFFFFLRMAILHQRKNVN